MQRKQLKASLADLEYRFQSSVVQRCNSIDGQDYAFDHNSSPIIRSETPEIIDTDYHWGLIPSDWNKPYTEIWNSTFSAKIEYLYKRYAYKNITHQRCLIPATSYFEYHWNDPKGKVKSLYEIVHGDSTIFTLAGLYSIYKDPAGVLMHTYTILTTDANEIMKFVHNKNAAKNFHRMPLMLNPEDERTWLDTSIDYMDFAYPDYQPRLIATLVSDEAEPPQQFSLF